MALTLLGCGCPCTESDNPCACCGCITSVKIYSNITLSVDGFGNYINFVESGSPQRPIDFTLSYTNTINSLIDIPNPIGIGSVTCASCEPVVFQGSTSDGTGFLACELDYEQIWQRAAGVECRAVEGPCIGVSDPPLEFGSCPKDVCLNDQVFHFSTTAGGSGNTDLQETNCNYDGEDHITYYYCSIDNTITTDPSAFYASFDICPSSSLFNLSIVFFNGDSNVGSDLSAFQLSTSAIGPQFGYAVLNSGANHIPLYINYTGPNGLSSKGISGTAVIGIEFDYNAVTRNPETNICPTI